MKNEQALAGKVVVITGASSGVGKAAALAFAQKGATVVLAARRAQALTSLAEACRELGAAAHVVVTDVTEAASVKALAASAATIGHGRIDVWVNNAGVLAAGPFDETPMEVHQQVIHTNLLGYMHGAHAALPYFKKQGAGILINNISIGGFVTLPYAGAYSASKMGVQGFMTALRAELTPYKNIHVCDLFPAFLDTPGLGHAANYTGAELHLSKALLFDPLRVAEAIVATAIRPKATTYPDGAGPLLKAFYRAFPGFTGSTAEWVMRKYFAHSKKQAPTSGNVLRPVADGTGIHSDQESKSPGKKMGIAFTAVAGTLAAFWLLSRRTAHTS